MIIIFHIVGIIIFQLLRNRKRLKHTENIPKNTDNDERRLESSITFDPPVYRQRYGEVYSAIIKEKWRKSISKLADFGCAEFGQFVFVKDTQITELFCVDIDESLLEEYSYKLNPLTYDHIKQRNLPLKIQVLCGRVAKPDERIKNCDMVTCIELIEHLYPDSLDALPYNIFSYIHPKIVIITTPNIEFNVLFKHSNTFRHYDHKFEWTRQQFTDWCTNITTRFPKYDVEFSGLGEPPTHSKQFGFCTQMATFIRKDMTDSHISGPNEPSECQRNEPCPCTYVPSQNSNCTCNVPLPNISFGVCTYESLSKSDFTDTTCNSYKLIKEIDYPYNAHVKSADETLLDTLKYRVIDMYGYVNSRFYVEERERCEIPLIDLMWGNLGVTMEGISNILQKNGFEIAECLVPETETCEICVIYYPPSIDDMEEVSSSSESSNFESDNSKFQENDESFSDWDDDYKKKTTQKSTGQISNTDHQVIPAPEVTNVSQENEIDKQHVDPLCDSGYQKSLSLLEDSPIDGAIPLVELPLTIDSSLPVSMAGTSFAPPSVTVSKNIPVNLITSSSTSSNIFPISSTGIPPSHLPMDLKTVDAVPPIILSKNVPIHIAGASKSPTKNITIPITPPNTPDVGTKRPATSLSLSTEQIDNLKSPRQKLLNEQPIKLHAPSKPHALVFSKSLPQAHTSAKSPVKQVEKQLKETPTELLIPKSSNKPLQEVSVASNLEHTSSPTTSSRIKSMTDHPSTSKSSAHRDDNSHTPLSTPSQEEFLQESLDLFEESSSNTPSLKSNDNRVHLKKAGKDSGFKNKGDRTFSPGVHDSPPPPPLPPPLLLPLEGTGKLRVNLDRVNELDKCSNRFINNQHYLKSELLKKSPTKEPVAGPSSSSTRKRKKLKKPELDDTSFDDAKSVANCILENSLNKIVVEPEKIEQNLEIVPRLDPQPQEAILIIEDLPAEAVLVENGDLANNNRDIEGNNFDAEEEIPRENPGEDILNDNLGPIIEDNLFADNNNDANHAEIEEVVRQEAPLEQPLNVPVGEQDLHLIVVAMGPHPKDLQSIEPKNDTQQNQEEEEEDNPDLDRASLEAVVDPNSQKESLTEFNVQEEVEEEGQSIHLALPQGAEMQLFDLGNVVLLGIRNIGAAPSDNSDSAPSLTLNDGFPDWLLQILGAHFPAEEEGSEVDNEDEPHYYCQGDGLGVHPSVAGVEDEDDADAEAETDSTESSNHSQADYAEIDPYPSEEQEDMLQGSQATVSNIEDEPEPVATQENETPAQEPSEENRNKN